MKDNQIHFNVKDNKVKISYKTPPNLEEFMQITFTAILSAMQATVHSQKTEAEQDQCKAELYDMLNVAASRTLEFFAPEYELRPNLTTQAILEAENKIIEREVKNKKDNISPFPYHN